MKIVGETKIGSNWEISIPLEALKELNMNEGDELIMIKRDDEIIIRKLMPEN
jgi:AbrB family looped-hinge helix DNA binding protein